MRPGPYAASALVGLIALAGCDKAEAPGVAAPPEPYSMVYTMASPTEATLLDLNSIQKTGDVAEVWSLTFLTQPVRFQGAPKDAQVFWTRARLDCAAGTGQFIDAIGMENGQPIFTVPVNSEPTALATAWPLDKEFVCDEIKGARTAATTFSEAVSAARNAMNPPAEAEKGPSTLTVDPSTLSPVAPS